MKKRSMRPTRGFWDWVMTGEFEGGEASTGTNG